jgi:hypothetical protein
LKVFSSFVMNFGRDPTLMGSTVRHAVLKTSVPIIIVIVIVMG